MKHYMLAILTLCVLPLCAQKTTQWKGGTPGQESEWNVASNWTTNQVPDEMTRVVIWKTNNGHDAMPVIDEQVVVASVHLFDSTLLTIRETGALTIDGTMIYSEGIVCYGGEIINNGTIDLIQLSEMKDPDQMFKALKGDGMVYLEGKALNNTTLAQQ